MMEFGARVSLLEKCHPSGYDRMQQEKTKVARLAKVTDRSDCETFSFTLIFPRVCEYTVCLFLVPFVFSEARSSAQGDLWQ